MFKELLNGVSLLGVDGQQVGDQILGPLGDIVPPRREEGVLAARDLLGKNLNTFVVEWGKATQQCVENAAHGPHVHTLRVPLVLHNLRCSVTNGSAWRHCLTVPNHLGKTEVGQLDLANSTGPNPSGEFTLIFLIFIAWLLGLGIFGGCKRNRVEEQVLRFDITVLGISDEFSLGIGRWTNRCTTPDVSCKYSIALAT